MHVCVVCRVGNTVGTNETWADGPCVGVPGAQDLCYEGRSPVEMAEHTSPMFLLFSPLTIAWAFWVLEGLCLLLLMEFSREQLHVSTHLLVLLTLSVQVTWASCVPSGVWEQNGLPLGTGTGRSLGCF